MRFRDVFPDAVIPQKVEKPAEIAKDKFDFSSMMNDMNAFEEDEKIAGIDAENEINELGELLVETPTIDPPPPELIIERVPRTVLLQFLQTTPLDVNYTFHTRRYEGGNFVQAMRQILSRLREAALRQKRELTRWRFFQVSIITGPHSDCVTIMRSQTQKKLNSSTYEEFLKDLGDIQL